LKRENILVGKDKRPVVIRELVGFISGIKKNKYLF